jgi:large subunit ribosomal protein L23
MGLFDRFKPKHEKLEPKKPRHVVETTKADKDKQAFQAVPKTDREGRVIETAEVTKPKADKEKERAVPISAKSGADVAAATRILIQPIITEKSSRLLAYRQYVFAVHPTATKITVKRAVETAYGVRPTTVQISNVRGRSVRYGKTMGRTSVWKKAIVTLPLGKSLAIYEG